MIADAIGGRDQYLIAMSEGWFNGSQQTPWESVFYSDYEQFIDIMNIHQSVHQIGQWGD